MPTSATQKRPRSPGDLASTVWSYKGRSSERLFLLLRRALDDREK